ncbi:MAG TPA: hypothetical protein VFB58_08655 [Chloroflexota bacterium]|nr:hypothetical protein [Chloroflexota bacterium]
MRLEARAPLRLDFCGGWTDPTLIEWDGSGATVTAAITRYVAGYHDVPTSPREGSRLEYRCGVPPGSGLGEFAAEAVLWVTLVRTPVANTLSRADIAAIACQVQLFAGMIEGRQDAYASALGGLNFVRLGRRVEVERLDLGSLTWELQRRLILVRSGIVAPDAAGTRAEHDSAMRERLTPEAVTRLSDVAAAMKSSLIDGDLDTFGARLTEAWNIQRTLLETGKHERLEQLMRIAERNGAIGGTACGRGSCAIFLAREGHEAGLRRALRTETAILDFDFDTYGVHLKKG